MGSITLYNQSYNNTIDIFIDGNDVTKLKPNDFFTIEEPANSTHKVRAQYWWGIILLTWGSITVQVGTGDTEVDIPDF